LFVVLGFAKTFKFKSEIVKFENVMGDSQTESFEINCNIRIAAVPVSKNP